MKNEQVVDFRFGDRYAVGEFIQSQSYAINQITSSIPNDQVIQYIVAFVRDEFQYPLDSKGNPSTDGRLIRYHQDGAHYQFNAQKYYIWAFPTEVLISKFGYCAETANLSTSLLRSKNVNAYTGIGEVRKIDDTLLGYHAWTIINDDILQETTMHKGRMNTAIPLKDIYDKNSSFAQTGNVYYVEHGRYNEKEYIGKTPLGQSGIIFQLLGKPHKFLDMYGLPYLNTIKPRKIYREWQKEQLDKLNYLILAFGGGV